jgi:hypothetical protein
VRDAFWYQNYVGGAVSTQIIDKFDLSLTNFILIGARPSGS